MKVRRIVEEVVRDAVKRNKGREQYFYIVVRSSGFDSSGFPVGEERVDQCGLTVDEDGFRNFQSVPGDFMSVPGDLLIAMPTVCWVSRRVGSFWNGEKEERTSASLDLWRFDWDDGNGTEWLETIKSEYPYRGFDLDSDANEEEEKKIRETLEELFRINEEYDGEEVKVEFWPHAPRPGDKDGIDGYLFETSDPEYLRSELNAFRVTAFALGCEYNLVIASDAVPGEEIVSIDENTSDETIDGICERFRSCDGEDPITVVCNWVKESSQLFPIPF